MAEDFHHKILRWVSGELARDGVPIEERLSTALRLLAKHRGQLVGIALHRQSGPLVRSGPFQGMKLPVATGEGCVVPKLLGCYEAELHPIWQRCQQRGYNAIINIGCADGFYAVGLARLMPDATVYAHDIVAERQSLCRQLAEDNGVGERVIVGGTFAHGDFAQFSAQRTLVLCDIEGDELTLLDPEQAPALAGMDILVELHDAFRAGLSDTLTARFAPTHDIERIGHGGRNPAAYGDLARAAELDQWLAVWEWRDGPTPWAFMTAKNPGRPTAESRA